MLSDFVAFSVIVEFDVFLVMYATSMIQITVFVIYTAARLRKVEPQPSSLNYVQTALVTSAFLVGACVCLYQAQSLEFSITKVDPADGADDQGEGEELNKFLVGSLLLYVHWLWCQIYWIHRLSKIVSIKVTG